MELPPRGRGDELLKPGELAAVRLRLRNIAPKHDLTTVIACAFDHRTRMLPFIYADTRMIPAGVRAIGSAMVDAGFTKTRIVLQQWNRNFRPSQMRLDGRIPDIFMISSMQLHTAPCKAMIQDACRIDPTRRPLIIVGGPKVMYEPWDVFSAKPENPWAADVAVTGEEYVLMNLLEVVLSIRAGGESIRAAFVLARDSGLLDGIPGLVYARGERDGVSDELVDTGIQRLVGDLDELADPVLGYRLLEPPNRGGGLASLAIPANRVGRYGPVGSLVLTLGCKFVCPYCPIPAYNQRQYRTKSGDRIAEEIGRLYSEYHIRFFFGADDNFFNDKERTLDIAGTLARKVDAGSRPHCKIRLGTEATIHDTLLMKEHLPLIRRAGVWGLWLGVEDMSGSLVKKGQSTDKTLEAFALLRAGGIFPVPMMMHHDAQPLYTRNDQSGLLNQIGLLRKAGALYMQVMMLTPSPGSKLYVETYTSGLAYQSVDGIPVQPHVVDGNHVVASRAASPWKTQFNILAAYLYFYNPLRFLAALFCPKSNIPLSDVETSPISPSRNKLRRRILRKASAYLADAAVQVFGMWGLANTIRRTFVWGLHLMRGKIKRHTCVPASKIPMRGVDGAPASHALPGTPTPREAPSRD
ncbi:MAG: B12-binding domain-containing radical SAM protein [Phycisphaerae bacterium]|nr:B12-binding domain-containing radical SAM protein [Phycisphaerae bacterium]